MISIQPKYTVAVSSPPRENVWVTIDAGRIVDLTDHPIAGKQVRLDRAILIPGLVNAHTHLELSDTDRPLGEQGMSLTEWFPLVIAHRNRRAYDQATAVRRGIDECLRTGTVLVGDIAQNGWSSQWFTDAGLAAIGFHELLGRTPERIRAAKNDVDKFLATFLSGAGNSPPVLPGISPHAPHSTGPELIRYAVAQSNRHQIPLAMHLAETREELELLRYHRGPLHQLMWSFLQSEEHLQMLGSTPLDYLDALSEAPRALVIHGNYLSQIEIDRIAANRERMAVVYCPRSHAWFRHEPYPLLAMLNSGVPVALGTDSRASSGDLNLLDDMRHVAQCFPAVPKAEILRMATLDGARALGMEDRFGSIEPGKSAQLAVLQPGEGVTSGMLQEDALFDLAFSAEHAQSLQAVLLDLNVG